METGNVYSRSQYPPDRNPQEGRKSSENKPGEETLQEKTEDIRAKKLAESQGDTRPRRSSIIEFVGRQVRKLSISKKTKKERKAGESELTGRSSLDGGSSSSYYVSRSSLDETAFRSNSTFSQHFPKKEEEAQTVQVSQEDVRSKEALEESLKEKREKLQEDCNKFCNAVYSAWLTLAIYEDEKANMKVHQAILKDKHSSPGDKNRAKRNIDELKSDLVPQLQYSDDKLNPVKIVYSREKTTGNKKDSAMLNEIFDSLENYYDKGLKEFEAESSQPESFVFLLDKIYETNRAKKLLKNSKLRERFALLHLKLSEKQFVMNELNAILHLYNNISNKLKDLVRLTGNPSIDRNTMLTDFITLWTALETLLNAQREDFDEILEQQKEDKFALVFDQDTEIKYGRVATRAGRAKELLDLCVRALLQQSLEQLVERKKIPKEKAEAVLANLEKALPKTSTKKSVVEQKNWEGVGKIIEDVYNLVKQYEEKSTT